MKELSGKLSKQLASFIRENYTDFLTYDKIKVYYDNGQIELTRILSLVLNALLPKVEFRRVIPSDYRLFQVADLICTLELERLKMENKMISKHELEFWGKESEFKKNYLKEYIKRNMDCKKGYSNFYCRRNYGKRIRENDISTVEGSSKGSRTAVSGCD